MTIQTRPRPAIVSVLLLVATAALTGCNGGILQDDASPATQRQAPAARSVPLTGPATPGSRNGAPGSGTPAAGRTGSAAEGPAPTPSAPAPPRARLTLEEVQGQVRGFADQFRSEVASATEQIMRRRTEPEIRMKAHQYKLDAATAVYDIAAETNPQQAVLDMLVLVTLQWYDVEAHQGETFGEDIKPLRDATRLLKDTAWSLAARVISDRQRGDLLEVIDRWWEDNAGDAEIWYVRIGDIAGYSAGTGLEDALGAFTNLPGAFLNAFVPVSDAAQTLDDAQATAERITWLAPRLMILAQWRAEAIIFKTLATTEIGSVLESTNRAVAAADRATTVAEGLPSEIAAQTRGVFSDFAENEATIRALLDESRQAIDSAEKLAGTTRTAVADAERTFQAADQLTRTFDEMLKTMQAFGDDDGESEQTGGDPGRPFDVTEYTEALNAATATLEEANRTLLNFQSTTDPAALQARLDSVSGSGRGLVDHAAARLERVALIVSGSLAAAGVLIVLTLKLVPGRRSGA
jgi:hypothetical protein